MSTPTGRSFYEVLGVHPHAQRQEIKNAYRMLALRYHPDKNQGDASAKELFQEIQAAYETLSENDKRAKYDTTVGFVRTSHSTRAWREPCYDPCYTRDPPFWSVELREMTVQKCARIAKIQHLEREIRELVIDLDDLVDAENRAVSKEKKALGRFTITRLRSRKINNTQRHQDFLTKSIYINARLNEVKSELRTAHEDHKTMLEKDNKRKTWWARERVRRVEEENRRAATTAAEAARRKNERAREWEPTRVAEEIRQRAREEGIKRAREMRAEEETRMRAERARKDPEGAERAEREAREWLKQQREG